MDWFTFIAEIAKALAWPVTVLFTVWLLRHAIRGVIPNIRRLKYKDFEADFSKDLERAGEQAQQARLPPEEDSKNIQVGLPEPAGEKYRRLAEISPRAAVIEAWRDVEIALSDAASAGDFDGLRFERHPNLSAVIERLTREGKLDPGEQQFLEYMRWLRNQAAHRDIDLRSDQAYRYAMLASQMTAGLKSKKKSDGPVVIQDVG